MVEHPIYIKICSFLSTLAPAIFGSLISLKFSIENTSYFNRFISVISGIIISHYVVLTIIEVFKLDLNSMVVSGLYFTSGLFGFTVMSEISKQIPEVVKNISGKITGLIK